MTTILNAAMTGLTAVTCNKSARMSDLRQRMTILIALVSFLIGTLWLSKEVLWLSEKRVSAATRGMTILIALVPFPIGMLWLSKERVSQAKGAL